MVVSELVGVAIVEVGWSGELVTNPVVELEEVLDDWSVEVALELFGVVVVVADDELVPLDVSDEVTLAVVVVAVVVAVVSDDGVEVPPPVVLTVVVVVLVAAVLSTGVLVAVVVDVDVVAVLVLVVVATEEVPEGALG